MVAIRWRDRKKIKPRPSCPHARWIKEGKQDPNWNQPLTKVKENGIYADDYTRPGLAIDEVNELKIVFDKFDTEKVGMLNTISLKNAMQSLGLES